MTEAPTYSKRAITLENYREMNAHIAKVRRFLFLFLLPPVGACYFAVCCPKTGGGWPTRVPGLSPPSSSVPFFLHRSRSGQAGVCVYVPFEPLVRNQHYIDSTAEISEQTKVGPDCVVGEHTTIGDRCRYTSASAFRARVCLCNGEGGVDRSRSRTC